MKYLGLQFSSIWLIMIMEIDPLLLSYNGVKKLSKLNFLLKNYLYCQNWKSDIQTFIKDGPSNKVKMINISATLMDYADDLLLSKIDNNGLHTYFSIKQQLLKSFNFTSNPLIFIQLVKDFIPSSLVNHLRSILSQSITNQVLINILGKLNDSIYEMIWIPRCKAMVIKEQSLNIGVKIKKKKVKYKVNG